MRNAVQELLDNRFVIKALDKEKYFRVKDEVPKIRKFFQEKLGYRIIVNPLLIKLEKLPPGQAEPSMGIGEFTSLEEYGVLVVVLMFLEDKSPEEQFVLSQLTEYIQVHYTARRVDWTSFGFRRSFIRVMKFCRSNYFFKTTDGDEDNFAHDTNTEVLYEVTGVSRYFVRSFATDISDFRRASDFEHIDWLDMDEDRGVIRRNRVYRRLLLSPAVYKAVDCEDEDFTYIRNIRNTIEKDFDEVLDCSLHIHSSFAAVVQNENAGFGRVFPENTNLSDISLSLLAFLREDVEAGKLSPGLDERIRLNSDELCGYIAKCLELYGKYYGKTFREKSAGELAADVREYLCGLDFGRLDGEDFYIMPVAAKIIGTYGLEQSQKEN